MFVVLMHVLMEFIGAASLVYALHNWLPVNCYSSVVITS